MDIVSKRIIAILTTVALCALPLSACSSQSSASNASSSETSQSAASEESYDIVIGEEGYDTFSFVISNATDLTFGSSAAAGSNAESIVARPAGSLEYSEVLPLADPWEPGQAAKMYFVDTALSAATVDSVESNPVETEASESETANEAVAAETAEGDTANTAADLLIEGACDLKLIASNGSEYVLHQLVPSKLQDAQDIQLKIDSATSLAYIEYELNGQIESTLQSEIGIKNAEDEALAAQAAEEAAAAEAAKAAEAAAAEQAAAEYQNYNSADVAQQDDACVSADDIQLR